MKLILSVVNFEDRFKIIFDILETLSLFAARLYVSWAFFKAGLTKINDWDTTLFLFEEEYAVPLLPPELAAYLGTFGELFFPVLIVLGIFPRLGALGLFFVNIVAVISLEEIAPAALKEHIIWGMAIAAVVIWGPGKIAVNTFLKRFLNNKFA